MPTHYDLLGVPQDAPRATIRRSYLALVKRLHPDANPSLDGARLTYANHLMADVNEAWYVLGDVARRATYDKELASPARRMPRLGVAPRGFALYPREWRGFGRATHSEDIALPSLDWWRHADKMRGALSLEPFGGDLSGLRALDADGVWKLVARNRDVRDPGLEHVARLTGLTVLDLSTSGVTDDGVGLLDGLTKLESLNLSYTAIGDGSLRAVGSMHALYALHMDGTRVSDAGLEHLSGLRRLDSLSLRATQVRGPGLRSLHALRSLRLLALPFRGVDRHARRALRAAMPDVQLIW